MKLTDLIDRAASIAGSDYKLAKTLGIPPQHVSDWRHSRRTCTPEDWALLASIAGLDPEEALIRAVLAKHADTPKGERLTTALGKGLHRIGARASFVTCASLGFLLTTMVEAMRSATMYIGQTPMRAPRSSYDKKRFVNSFLATNK